MIYIVAAYDKNRGIGYKGVIPWPRMAADKQRFHKLIQGNDILMGMKTYREYQRVKHAFSVKNAYVLSRQAEVLDDGVILRSIFEVIELSARSDLWVIGGAQIYEQLIPYADKMYLTSIDGSFLADTFFPDYEESEWRAIETRAFPADENNPYPYTFLSFERSNRKG